MFICSICKNTVSNRSNFLEHVRSHNKNFICDIRCKRLYQSDDSFRKHLRLKYRYNGYLDTIDELPKSIVKNKRSKIDSSAEVNVSFIESHKSFYPTNIQLDESNESGQNLFRRTNSDVDQNELTQKILF